jgi:peptidoglycan/xylan/chitin deacetylase (PgdA/CDA1 family)
MSGGEVSDPEVSGAETSDVQLGHAVPADRLRSAAGGVSAFGPEPRRPKLTALHLGSAVVHFGAAATLVAMPQSWPWCLAAIAGNHAFNTLQTLFPQGQLLGPALTRLPAPLAQRGAVALTFDDGPDPEVTPWLLDQLDCRGARATFFCTGERVLRYPQLARAIVARGHAVENHSYAHSPSGGFWGVRRWRRDIAAAQDAIAQSTGVLPRFFRPPFGVRTPLLEPALAALGLHCVTWSARGFDTVARDAAQVLARLAPQLVAGAIVLLHDGVATARRERRAPLREIAPAFLSLLEARRLRSINLRALCGE